MIEPSKEYVYKKNVSCDGGDMGHPKIYLELGDDNKIICPYCSKTFIYREVRKK